METIPYWCLGIGIHFPRNLVGSMSTTETNLCVPCQRQTRTRKVCEWSGWRTDGLGSERYLAPKESSAWIQRLAQGAREIKAILRRIGTVTVQCKTITVSAEKIETVMKEEETKIKYKIDYIIHSMTNRTRMRLDGVTLENTDRIWIDFNQYSLKKTSRQG